MKSLCYNNSDYLLSLLPKRNIVLFIIFSMIMVVLIYSCYIDVDDVYVTKSYYECNETCNIKISIDPNNISILNNIDYITIDKCQIYHYDITVNEITNNYENNISYQLVDFKIDNQKINNKTMQELKIYYNKEKLINKIISIIFE